MRKEIDGKQYEFLPDSENSKKNGCNGCYFQYVDCNHTGIECISEKGIWKEVKDDSATIQP